MMLSSNSVNSVYVKAFWGIQSAQMPDHCTCREYFWGSLPFYQTGKTLMKLKESFLAKFLVKVNVPFEFQLATFPFSASWKFPLNSNFRWVSPYLNWFSVLSFQTYLQSFIGLCSKISDCPISAMSGRPLTKRDLCDFAPFFKQGIFEQTKNYTG